MFKLNDKVRVIATGQTGDVTDLTDQVEVRLDETVQVKKYDEYELELIEYQA